jgi:predicted metal-dependent phosphoesterase TrpH
LIDLHTHSTFSDGSLSPEALVDLAGSAGLSALALTDHDTTDGIPFFMDACQSYGITGVAGVEISVDFSPGTMHMLGYFVDIDNCVLQAALLNIRKGREHRNQKILAKLCDIGMEMEWSEIAAFAGSDVVGRPHFAQAMLARGYVATKNEVFDLWLGRGKPGYVERFRLSPQEGISAIKAAGGVAVLAHPFTLGLRFTKLRSCVAELVDVGLQGMEVFYPMHKPEQLSQYLKLVQEFNLTATGGSDFHGDMNPAIHIGRGFDNIIVKDSVLDELRQCS